MTRDEPTPRVEAEPDEALRAAALALLDAGGDPRASALLANAALRVVRDVSHWDASPGAVRAHRVLLGVRAEELGLLSRAPAVHDELCRVLSAAIAERDAGETLADLREHWLPATTQTYAEGGGPYRPAPRVITTEVEPATVHDALTDLLTAQGETAIAHDVARSELTLQREAGRVRVTLVLPRDVSARDPHRRAVIERAVSLLLAGPDARAVRLALRGR